MRKVIFVHGMKRSGNHGVIHWLAAHGRFLFFNNIVPIRPILSGEKPLPPPEDYERWLRRQLQLGTNKKLPAEGEASGSSSHGEPTVILSLEDHELTFRPLTGVPRDALNVLILRDPCNMLASRIRKALSKNSPAYPRRLGPDMDRILRLWKVHARELLGRTRALENKTCIYFNSWFSSEPYRRSVSRRLGLEFTDRGFARVSGIGGGSSFDGTRYDGDNQKLDVLNRQRYLTDSERQMLEAAVADQELRELAEQVAAKSEAVEE